MKEVEKLQERVEFDWKLNVFVLYVCYQTSSGKLELSTVWVTEQAPDANSWVTYKGVITKAKKMHESCETENRAKVKEF